MCKESEKESTDNEDSDVDDESGESDSPDEDEEEDGGTSKGTLTRPRDESPNSKKVIIKPFLLVFNFLDQLWKEVLK